MKQKVYDYLKTIPQGKVVTYGQIAEYLGNPHLARAVGNILHVNPDPIGQPCFRVVNAQGRLAENFGGGGIDVQRQRLEADGIEVINGRVDLNKYQYKPVPATAHYHLPGLFEFYDFYKLFLPLYREKRSWFYDRCDISSVYGSPAECIWSGGRAGGGTAAPADVLALMKDYGISARLTFSNSLLREEHLSDGKCNKLCAMFEKSGGNGVIIHSDLLLDYLKNKFPGLYLVSSTTKVLAAFEKLRAELDRVEFRYVVPDFRLNKSYELLAGLTAAEKDKTEFLCNECCSPGCRDRYACYENVSRINLGESIPDFICRAPGGSDGYRFSRAMENPFFIGTDGIRDRYLPMGFSNFKIEGRGLGSAILLEFLLYYLTKPEYRLKLREEIYLDSMLDLF